MVAAGHRLQVEVVQMENRAGQVVDADRLEADGLAGAAEHTEIHGAVAAVAAVDRKGCVDAAMVPGHMKATDVEHREAM